MNNKTNTHCPICNSKKIFLVKITPDIESDNCKYGPANGSECYTEEEWKYDSKNCPEINEMHCLNCGSIWAESFLKDVLENGVFN